MWARVDANKGSSLIQIRAGPWGRRYRKLLQGLQAQHMVDGNVDGPGFDGPGDEVDEVDPVALERVMREVPKGAFALAGLTVGLLIAAWLLIYIFVFLPRGMVG